MIPRCPPRWGSRPGQATPCSAPAAGHTVRSAAGPPRRGLGASAHAPVGGVGRQQAEVVRRIPPAPPQAVGHRTDTEAPGRGQDTPGTRRGRSSHRDGANREGSAPPARPTDQAPHGGEPGHRRWEVACSGRVRWRGSSPVLPTRRRAGEPHLVGCFPLPCGRQHSAQSQPDDCL